MPENIIDTHIHIWDFDQAEYEWLKGNTSILNRSYALDELDSVRQEAGITEGILVQAANNLEDTDWMLKVASRHPWIIGVVGWLPLMHPENCRQVYQEKYKEQPLFKGVRHLIHDEKDPRWLLQPGVVESLHFLSDNLLTYDLVGVLTDHIETALQLVTKLPSLKMVFDHMNQPPISKGEKFGKWGALMKEAAQHPSFYVKISGLGLTAAKKDWSADDIKPYIEFALTYFGADRCFCGGDWPVSLLAGDYVQTWKIYKEAISDLLNKEEQQKIFYNNAQRFYQL